MTNEQINLNEQDIMLGILNDTKKHTTINACIILAKWYIYKNKLNESQIFLYKFLCDLKYYIMIERTIAIKNQKMTQYNQKWQQIEHHIT